MSAAITRLTATSVRLSPASSEPTVLLIPAHLTSMSLNLMKDLVDTYQRYAIPVIQHMLLNRNTEGLTGFEALEIMTSFMTSTQCFDTLEIIHQAARSKFEYETLLPVSIVSLAYGREIDVLFNEKAVTYGYKASLECLPSYVQGRIDGVALIEEHQPAANVKVERSVKIKGQPVALGTQIDEATATTEELVHEAQRLLKLAMTKTDGQMDLASIKLADIVLGNDDTVAIIQAAVDQGNYDSTLFDLTCERVEYKSFFGMSLRDVVAASEMPIPTFMKTHAKALLAVRGLVDKTTNVQTYLQTNPAAFEMIKEELNACVGRRLELEDLVNPEQEDREIGFSEVRTILSMHGLDSEGQPVKPQTSVAAEGASTGAFAGGGAAVPATTPVAARQGGRHRATRTGK